MKCPRCGSDVVPEQGFCVHCGWKPPAKAESLGKRNPVLVIGIALVAFLTIVAAAGPAGYRALKAGFVRIQSRIVSGGALPRRRLPVEHGRAIRPEELHGHGKLYFVPVGSQAIPAQTLAGHYREKFGAQVTVLPQVEIRPGDCVPQRRQCVAEELEAEMTNSYPDISRNPDSVMIALTDEDIFPRELGWKFTYSLHSIRIGIVSTRRMDPAFWGDPPNERVRLANTEQMLTKYVGILYFHLPESFDPTSILYTPLTPNGGADDLYESDLHSEASVNGQRGKPFPCLYFVYSYQSHTIQPDEPYLSDCWYHNPVHGGEETFEVNLGWGSFTEESMDVQLDATPRIELKRGYNSDYKPPSSFAFGWGANHSYDQWLASDGLSSLSYLSVIHEDGFGDYFGRLDKARGFAPNAIYESHDDEMYGARLTWENDLYKLRYRDGAASTFLECDSPTVRCYWTGYQDAKGNALRFDRSRNQDLQQLTSTDGQGIKFRYDNQHRIVSIAATDGSRLSYQYDPAGCLAQAQRADGQVAVYEYDSGRRMASFSVAAHPGAVAEPVLTNQYDSQGRLVSINITGVGGLSDSIPGNRRRR